MTRDILCIRFLTRIDYNYKLNKACREPVFANKAHLSMSMAMSNFKCKNFQTDC